MTEVNINIVNQGYESHPNDRVVIYSPANRNHAGQIISTAVKEVPLVDGKATEELAPGPVVVRLECLGVADTREKSGYVPETGPVSLWDVILDWTPALVDQGILAILVATERAATRVDELTDDARIARVVQGKNLYNPIMDSVGYYIMGPGAPIPAGDLMPLSGYRTTDVIPVVPGEAYALSVARHWAFYDADRTCISDSWAQSQPQGPRVVTAPVGAAYMRMSYWVAHTPENVQIEQGSVHTSYEPYQRVLDPVITIPEVEEFGAEIVKRPTVSEVESLVATEITTASRSFARVIPGKNLYNPDTDGIGFYVAGGGGRIDLEGYRTTDFIPVIPGESYALSVMRHLTFWNADKVFLSGGWVQSNPQQAWVVTAPVGAAYMRMSYWVAHTPENVQIEQGSVHTSYEPYGRQVLDPAITVQVSPAQGVGPLQVSRSGDVITMTSELGEQDMTQEVTLGSGRNAVLNFTLASHGAVVQELTDDIAPIRTQQGTVGANHGLPGLGRWPAGTHDKAQVDVGSTWTDGSHTYAIIYLDASGHLWVGRNYTTNPSGEVVSHSVTPSTDLTHVSGATNATPLSASSRVSDQLAPWVQRRRVVVEMDGRPVTDGSTSGRALTIRESYEILDYGTIWDWVTTHVGQSYTDVHHRAAVGVETAWIFHPGGKTRHRTRLWEIRPTRLAACGFLQAITLPGTVTRWIPGVGVKDGLDWAAGVDLSQLTSSQSVRSTDLIDPRLPPTMVVDARSDLGLAVAVSPWVGASSSAVRLAATPSSLWDIRSTKKIYPVVVNGLAPGWGHLEVEGIRSYLTPEEVQSIVADADPVSAWVTLDQMSR